MLLIDLIVGRRDTTVKKYFRLPDYDFFEEISLDAVPVHSLDSSTFFSMEDSTRDTVLTFYYIRIRLYLEGLGVERVDGNLRGR